MVSQWADAKVGLGHRFLVVPFRVLILEKCYENAIIARRLSTFHAMKSYPFYRNWYF